ncbi:MAG: FAD-dependent oxidoreductase [Candidatus Marinimicrobia bacterium]|nr:FAD-dependent oxidoreductase [Candidatus Neomarinimicrobiota bacterium]|tara:strand:- start:1655 stop:2902 length:1248 start_codon:yes stop_codon:yes gene_type:complete
MKIAIIGSGISGLTASYLLNRSHNIILFEKNDYVGGHTHTHEINHDGKIWNVDSGFIVYNEWTYPNFIKLLDQLGVERQVTRMGFSVKSLSKNLEYAGHSLNALFAQRSNLFSPSFFRMLGSMKRFNKEAKRDLQSLDETITLDQYLQKNNYPIEFIENYIIPIGAAIWSTVPSNMLNIPAMFFIRFFNNHGLLQILDRPKWWVIKGGSYQYVKKIIADFKQSIRLSTPVNSIKRNKESVIIRYGSQNQEEEFDAVVLATHSNQALQLLEEPSGKEKEILSLLPYQRNDAVLHFDESILPKRKLAWSSWNYLLDKNKEDPVALTYNMNILQGLNSSKTFCVTLNSLEMIDKSKIIKNLSYEHPLFTIDGIRAQKRKSEISGHNNTFYCGAYWRNGFHEDGVVSALDVCSQFGESL